MNFSQPWTTRMLILAVTLPFPLLASPSVGPQDSTEVVEYLQGNLKNDRELDGTRLTAKVTDGVAILSGRVSLLSQEQRAIRTAEAMKGVRAVISQIQVLPSIATDDAALASGVRKALEECPAIQAGSVLVKIHSGTAILEGAVDSPEERAAATDVLSNVPGIREVKNQLAVRTDREVPSTRLEAQVTRLLKQDVMLQGLEFGVQVKDHVLRLSGTVPSKAERNRLREMAAVTGVTDVDVTQVKVDRSLMMEEFEAKSPTDEEIRSALQASFEVSKEVPQTVQSRIENGFVTLKGTVEEAAAKEAIGRLARQTVGVSQVFNEIEIAGPSSKSDAAVSENIAAVLSADPELRSLEFFTLCQDGVCTIRGISYTVEQRTRATEVANGVTGVRSVIDNIAIEGAPSDVTTRSEDGATLKIASTH